jgi:hypothetical protein
VRRAFIIRPFGTKEDRAGRKIDFEQVSKDLIEPALMAADLGGGTTGEVIEAGNIREDMFRLIPNAYLVICDITILNANVFYELGIRHALRTKRTVLIRGEQSADDVPFDILTDRYLVYDCDKPGLSLKKLTDTLVKTLASDKTDSPVFKFVPVLTEIDPDTIPVVPDDLREEVERAKASKVAGWLRLLAQDVETQDFQSLALRLIGQAQWDIGDNNGARRTYEKLIRDNPDDVEANNALANLYEQQYQRENRSEVPSSSDNQPIRGMPELMAAFNQAVRRIAIGSGVSQKRGTEALSLAGSYARSLWRNSFEIDREKLLAQEKKDNKQTDPAVTQRRIRESAVNRRLVEAYDGFLKAYLSNLNHCRLGLAALQMCAITKDLAVEATWEDVFNNEQTANDKKNELGDTYDQLKLAVRLSINEAQKLPTNTEERIWADISNAEWLFLTDPKESRVRRAYTDSVPNTPRYLDAVISQLRLFASLEIKADLVNRIFADLEVPTNLPPVAPASAVVIVAGHRIDELGRPKARFPESAEPAVKERLRESLNAFKQRAGDVQILASAAPGTDIICHELCYELGIKSTMCLPMPVDYYSKETFKELDTWRSRFLALVAAKIPRLQLSNLPGLPKWLQGTGTDPWERTNRWVLQLALSTHAQQISLIAVWDGDKTDQLKGGTAHMVHIADEAGIVDIDQIKIKDGTVLPVGS